MLHPATLRAFKDELMKIAASANEKVEQHHANPNWSQFEKNLKGKKFREAASAHPKSDSKLQAYIKNFGGYLSSKKVLGQVPSRTSAKKHTIKELEGGRLGCSCKDWQYKHSHQGTDCAHIASFKTKPKTKKASIRLTPTVMAAFKGELEKIAARRGLKEIRQAISGGNFAKAQALSKTPGVLKATPLGHHIKDIGQGGEGLASLVAGPEHGLAVRKIYDPGGVASPELIARKEQAGRALQNNPHVARFYGSHEGVGGTAHTMEYVHGQTPTESVGGKRNPAVRAASRGVAKGMRRAGFVGATDVRPSNMIQTPQGAVKAFDYIPTQKKEFISGNERRELSNKLQAMGSRPLAKEVQVPVGDTSVLQKPAPVRMHPHQLTENFFRGTTHGPRIGQFKPLAEMMPQETSLPRTVRPVTGTPKATTVVARPRSLQNIAGPQDATRPMVHPNI